MATVLFRALFAVCIVGLAALDAASASVEVTKFQTTTDNVYFGEIKNELKNVGGDTSISMSVPLLKDLDDSFQVRASVNVSNIPILSDYVLPLCESVNNPFFKPLVDKIEPKEKTPIRCPMTAGEWRIVDFTINPRDYVPFDAFANMDFQMDMEIFRPNEVPAFKLEMEGLVKVSDTNFDLGSLLSFKA